MSFSNFNSENEGGSSETQPNPEVTGYSSAQGNQWVFTETSPSNPEPVKVRSRKKLFVVLALVAILGIGAGAWYLWTQPDRAYLAALQSKNLMKYFANDNVAIAQGRAFCDGLKQGEDATGFKHQKLAVGVYCSEFATGFKVIATPEEQQVHLLSLLRAKDLGGLYSSDVDAVTKSQAVCTKLDEGSVQQGPLQNYIAVKVYCDKYLNGYRVLRSIDVTGKFTITDYDSYFWSNIWSNKGKCGGAVSYRDIDSDTSVKVTNSAGDVLAETELGDGKGGRYKCVFTYHFTVLEGEKGYYLEIGSRGKLKYSEAELKTPKKLYKVGLW